MSPPTDEIFITYPSDIIDECNEKKLEYINKLLKVWTTEHEKLINIILIQDPPTPPSWDGVGVGTITLQPSWPEPPSESDDEDVW